MWLALAVALSFAAPPEIVHGEDLAAWEALQAPDATATATDYEAFILTFPDSPLAELAWAERKAMTPAPTSFRRRNRRLIGRLDRQLRAHQQALRKQPTVIAVGRLPPPAAPTDGR